MSDLYIKCKYIIADSDCKRIIKNGAIIVENNTIIAVGKEEQVKKSLSDHDKLDRTKHIAIPSLVNSHTHLPETLLRGICDDEKLSVWLNDYIWPFERLVSHEDAHQGALLGCLELIESGVGGFIDQYFYAEEIEKSAKIAGIRALLCPSIFDNTPESGSLEDTWNHVLKLVSRKASKPHDLVKYGLGPHAPYSVPEEYLNKILDLSSKYSLPIHIHLNETKSEVEETIKSCRKTPIEYINSLGFLNQQILAAHCVHTNKEEWKIMQNPNFTVLHNPQSNLKMSSGIAPIHKYLELGINVAVGTDGNASNNDLGMLEEIATSAMLQKYLENNPKVMNNAMALYLGSIAGLKAMNIDSKGISKDSIADITILDMERSHSWPQNNPLSNVIYSSSSSDVTDLITNGEIIYLNKKHQTLDKEKIIDNCVKISTRILGEMGR